jgi:hypothetical protein
MDVVHGCEKREKERFGARVSKAVVQKFTVFKNSPVIPGGTDEFPDADDAPFEPRPPDKAERTANMDKL